MRRDVCGAVELVNDGVFVILVDSVVVGLQLLVCRALCWWRVLSWRVWAGGVWQLGECVVEYFLVAFDCHGGKFVNHGFRWSWTCLCDRSGWRLASVFLRGSGLGLLVITGVGLVSLSSSS